MKSTGEFLSAKVGPLAHLQRLFEHSAGGGGGANTQNRRRANCCSFARLAASKRRRPRPAGLLLCLCVLVSRK